MVTRTTPFGRLTFDRDAIVHAALRGLVEDVVFKLRNSLGMRSIYNGVWTGNLQRGTVANLNDGDHEVIAWTEVGVVGLGYELGAGPIEQLGMTPETLTCGPDDVRGAVPGLPPELEPAFLMAVDKLPKREFLHNQKWYHERMAGVGFWLLGDRFGDSFFMGRILANGADRLAAWGSLQGNRLPRVWCGQVERWPPDPPRMVPIQAVIDAVTDRALKGPTEFAIEELATLCPTPPDPKRLLDAQRELQKVGITWPGSPEIPD